MLKYLLSSLLVYLKFVLLNAFCQVACAIRELVSMAGGADKPHIICGDFNSTPDSSVYQLTKEGYLNDSSVTKLQEITSVNQPEGQVI